MDDMSRGYLCGWKKVGINIDERNSERGTGSLPITSCQHGGSQRQQRNEKGALFLSPISPAWLITSTSSPVRRQANLISIYSPPLG